MKKRMSLLIGLLCMMLLFGCGTEKVQYKETDGQDIEGTEEKEKKDTADSEENKLLPGSLAQELGAREKWVTEWAIQKDTGSSKGISVNAEVKVPDTEAMQVTKITKKQFQTEEKKKIAEALFDEGSIIFVGNEGYETREEIAEAIADLQQEVREAENTEENMEDYVDMSLDEIDHLQELYDNFEEVEQGDYSVSIFRGTANGQPYTLQFEQSVPVYETDKENEENESAVEEIKEPVISFKPDYEAVLYDGKEGVAYGLDASEGEFGENQATKTKEQAEAEIRSFCENMGITGMEVETCYDLNWAQLVDNGAGEYEYEPFLCDGYMFILRRNINGCFQAKEICYGTLLINSHLSNLPEMLKICITDEGIIDLQYDSPAQVDSVMTKQAELLSFDQVKSVLTEQGTEFFGTSLNSQGVTFLEHMDLTYMRIEDSKEKGTYYLLPVWRLYQFDQFDMNNGFYEVAPKIINAIVINAINGNAIDCSTMEEITNGQ